MSRWVRAAVDGWRDLEGDRQIIVTPGGAVIHRPLPYVAKSRWLEDRGIVGDSRERYLEVWRAMESEYLADVNKREGDS